MAPDGLKRFKEIIEHNHEVITKMPPEWGMPEEAPADVAASFLLQQVDEIVVSANEGHREMWVACLNRGIQVTDVTAFVEREYYKVPCDDVDMTWFIRIDLKWNHSFFHRFKRLADIALAGIGILVLLPLVALAAAATLLESGSPVLYSQMRVGFRGRSYRLWKLRTMRVDAEASGPEWAKKGDSRITKVGNFLRRTRLDETPQFWNVIKGEMSMIGPRPERPEFVDRLANVIPMYSQRHWVKPGITGWAQINYPYGASIADAREKLCFDLYYLKNASVLLDSHIALRTIGAIMKGSR